MYGDFFLWMILFDKLKYVSCFFSKTIMFCNKIVIINQNTLITFLRIYFFIKQNLSIINELFIKLLKEFRVFNVKLVLNSLSIKRLLFKLSFNLWLIIFIIKPCYSQLLNWLEYRKRRNQCLIKCHYRKYASDIHIYRDIFMQFVL